jgi:HEAT repeat protein
MAAGGLGNLGPAAAQTVPALTDLLDKDPNCAYAAAEALGQIGSAAASAVPGLIRAVQANDDSSLRMAAIEALGKLGPLAKEAVPALQSVQHGSDSRASAAAWLALQAIGPVTSSRFSLDGLPDLPSRLPRGK